MSRPRTCKGDDAARRRPGSAGQAPGLAATADVALDWSSAGADRSVEREQHARAQAQRGLGSVLRSKVRIEGVSKSYAAGVVHRDDWRARRSVDGFSSSCRDQAQPLGG